VDGLEVDLEHRRVFVQGNEVQLTATEYDLLRLLVTHAGKVLTHNQILRQMWGPAYMEQPHLLRVNISNLRRKITCISFIVSTQPRLPALIALAPEPRHGGPHRLKL
jgi:DNA-binding response OmpR family regulator